MHRRILVTVVLVILGIVDMLGMGPPLVSARRRRRARSRAAPISDMSGVTQDALSKDVAGRTERVLVLTGKGAVPVQVNCDDTQFFADFAEIYPDSHRIVATGNVKVGTPNSFISAERLEFDTKSRTGMFYQAHGMASLGDRVDKSMFGTQEADAIFRGREIHKLGPKKYKIVDGAFSTCVQPTPRWEIVSGSSTINLDDYALLKNSVFRVKGVPVMYLPIFYYPIQEDDRATGFLIPTYGTSTLRGQSLSNAFFWAISRSQDATFEHDWFSKAGQQMGGEYRYIVSGGSQGTARVLVSPRENDRLRDGRAVRRAAQLSDYRRDDADARRPLARARQCRLRLGHRARAAVPAEHLPRDAEHAQLRRQHHRQLESVRSQRHARPDRCVLSRRLVHDLWRTSAHQLQPRRAPHRQVTVLLRRRCRVRHRAAQHHQQRWGRRSTTRASPEWTFAPTLRIPFTRWPFLTVNSMVGWHGTYWSESLVDGKQVPESPYRQYFEFSSRITGPVFSRIFNAGATEGVKLKHVIEPVFTIRRVSAIDVFDQIVQLEVIDYTRGDVWEVGYGLNNRLYAKRTSSREVLNVAIRQNYYTDALAALLCSAVSEQQLRVEADRANTARWRSRRAPRPTITYRANSARSGIRRSAR